MISLTHILLIVLVLVVLFGPNKLPEIGRSIGKGTKNFKKALKGEEDIDITHTVKRIEDDNDESHG